LYRALAQRNPDAFQPVLATSLGMFGKILQANNRHEEALVSFGEALRILTRPFQICADAHAPVMAGLVQDYLRLAKATGRFASLQSK
jgi:hypothetical protein